MLIVCEMYGVGEVSHRSYNISLRACSRISIMKVLTSTLWYGSNLLKTFLTNPEARLDSCEWTLVNTEILSLHISNEYILVR